MLMHSDDITVVSQKTGRDKVYFSLDPFSKLHSSPVHERRSCRSSGWVEILFLSLTPQDPSRKIKTGGVHC